MTPPPNASHSPRVMTVGAGERYTYVGTTMERSKHPHSPQLAVQGALGVELGVLLDERQHVQPKGSFSGHIGPFSSVL